MSIQELLLVLKDREAITTFDLTDKQKLFAEANQDEVLYGGAAGGGKSYAQLIDAWIKAIKFPGIKQLVLRRTFPELKRSLVMTSLMIYKQEHAKYNESDKKWKFNNGSIIEFGYCDSENDVTQYQSAEYDIVRFDELTHFTEFQYTYLISRIRGVNNHPKQIKSSSNPGSVGHEWVKRRFIENKIPMQVYTDDLERTSIFIPAKVQENSFLMASDPKYIQRLEQLPDLQKKALLDGDWDIFEGQYFNEFKRDVHVIEPFEIPKNWRRYITIDYGLDMLACYWVALSPERVAYVYRELYQSDLIISEAAKRILALTPENEEIHYILAPPDLWNRRQDTGKSAADIFHDNKVKLIKSVNDRVIGWYNLKEWLKPYDTFDEQTGEKKATANLLIFNNCVNLIRCLPAVQRDVKCFNDVATEPHELTHSCDSIRYFVAFFVKPNKMEEETLSGMFFKTELRMKGYKDWQIKRLVKGGKVKIIGD